MKLKKIEGFFLEHTTDHNFVYSILLAKSCTKLDCKW